MFLFRAYKLIYTSHDTPPKKIKFFFTEIFGLLGQDFTL